MIKKRLFISIGVCILSLIIPIAAWADFTYTPGGTVECDDIEIRSGSTFSSGGNAVTIHGTWKNSGIYTDGDSAVTFDSSSAEQIIQGSSNFYDIILNNSAGTGNWTMQDALTADNDLTITSGTLTLNSKNLTVTGDFTLTDTLAPNGGETISAIDTNNGLVKYIGTANVTLATNLSPYNNLEFDESGTSDPTYTLPDAAVTVEGTLTITDGTLATDNDKNLTVNGAFRVGASGVFTQGAVTLIFGGIAAGQTVTAGGSNFTSIQLSNTHADGVSFADGFTCTNFTNIQTNSKITFDDASEVIVTGALTITGGANPNEITIVSDNPGTKAQLTLQAGATQSISQVDVVDNDASSGLELVASGDDSSITNTTNWILGSAGTTATWTGTVSTVWNTAGNWSGGFVPRENDLVIIPDVSGASGNNPALDTARIINTLTVNTNGVFNLGGNNLTVTTGITSPGTLTATGTETITLGGSWNLSGGTFTCATSNVTFNGSTNVTVDPGSSAFSTVTVNKNDATNSVRVIDNDLTIGSNTLVIQNGIFEVTTNSTFNGNIEVQNGGTFLCQTSSLNLIFKENILFTVYEGGTLTLDGRSFDNEITLRSSAPGTTWTLYFKDGSIQTINYIDVQDSDASGGNTATANFSTNSGNNTNWTFLGGAVYDSVTGERIKDALVTLFKANSIIYTASPQSNPQTTDAEGRFYFEVESGKYYLESKHKDYKDYKGEVFSVSGTAISQNIMMDPLDVVKGEHLSIAHTVNKKVATTGDILTYTITIKNFDSSLTVSDVSIQANLPHDFKYVDGTSWMKNSRLPNPTSRTNPIWSLGDIASNTSRTITYRAIIGPDTPLGRNKNSANVWGAVSGTSTTAGPSVAIVEIKEGLFSKKGMIIGKVFNDKNGNDIQDEGEEGIPYAALVLEDGTMVTTDKNGSYSIPDVSQGMHVLRLDQRMLTGGPLTKESTMSTKELNKEKDSLGN